MKRVFDFCAALSAVIFLSPVFLALAIIVRCLHGSPVFFCQERPGLNGRPFTMLKFRTMAEARGARGDLLLDRERLTPFGKLLRSTSLDELPELFNVLLGDMSLVGPRPLLKQYLDRYTPEQARRHEVKPGITGWSQINGRNAITWEEKFRLDVWYVDNWSIWLDVQIVMITAWKILSREGINQPGQATMEEFNPVDKTGSSESEQSNTNSPA